MIKRALIAGFAFAVAVNGHWFDNKYVSTVHA
jgi:hypothetical protein